MREKIKIPACPVCGKIPAPIIYGNGFVMLCGCGATGPIFMTPRAAVLAWIEEQAEMARW